MKLSYYARATLATQSASGRTWSRIGHTPEHKIFGRHKGVKAFGAVSWSGLFRYRVQLSYFSQETFRAFLVAFRNAVVELKGRLTRFSLHYLDGSPKMRRLKSIT